MSRTLVGFAIFDHSPSSDQIQSFLDSAIRASRCTPKYMITDKGTQFWCRSFKAWCKRRGIRPRYGRIGEPASIAIVERFIRSMKQECTRCVLVPLFFSALSGCRRARRRAAGGRCRGDHTPPPSCSCQVSWAYLAYRPDNRAHPSRILGTMVSVLSAATLAFLLVGCRGR